VPLAESLPMTAFSPSYGSDAAGQICGFLFRPQQPALSIGSEQAAEWLAQAAAVGQPEGAYLWLHFNLAHTAAQPWLHRHAGLPPEFYDTLRDSSHSTRVERAEQSLIAVINDVRFDFSFDASDISTLWICVSERLVVTARQQPLRAVDNLRTAIKRGESPRSTTELLERLMRAQADTLVGIERGVTERIDGVEDELLVGRLDPKRAKLGVLRRLLVRLQRLLAPEPAALFRLLQRPPEWMAEGDVEELRQATEEFSVVLRDMGALQERIKLLQEEIAAQVAEENNRSLFVLTIVTVLALPINIIAGLLGMNVGGVPLAENPHGFWVVVALVASVTAVAVWVAFLRRGDR
jgi:zinc transporter